MYKLCTIKGLCNRSIIEIYPYKVGYFFKFVIQHFSEFFIPRDTGGSRGEGSSGWGPPEKSQIIGFLGITGSDPLKNHKDTKPAFEV